MFANRKIADPIFAAIFILRPGLIYRMEPDMPEACSLWQK